MVVGHHRLAEQRLDDRRAELFGQGNHVLLRAETTTSCQYRDLRSFVDDAGGMVELSLRRQRKRITVEIAAVSGDIRFRPRAIAGPVLNVLGNRDVRNGPLGDRGLHGFIDDIADVLRTHDALVVGRDIHEQFVEIHVLLIVRPDEVVKRVARDRKYRLPIEFRVIESVQQMDASGP